jgi:hypothetical protein
LNLFLKPDSIKVIISLTQDVMSTS